MKVYINHDEWQDATNIWIVAEDHRGRRHVAKPMKLEFVEMGDEKILHEPSLKINRTFNEDTKFLQALSDALSKTGYKPKDVEENAGELKAAKYHLEDLRKLLKIK